MNFLYAMSAKGVCLQIYKNFNKKYKNKLIISKILSIIKIPREKSLPGDRTRSIRCLLPLHWQRKNFAITLKHRG